MALFPSDAYADWQDVGTTQYWVLTTVANSSFGTGNLRYSPVSSSASMGSLTSNTITSTSGMSSNTVAYLVIPISGGNIESGKYFRLNAQEFAPKWYCYPESTGTGYTVNTPTTNLRYWGYSGSWRQLSLDGDGMFKAQYAYTYIAVSWTSPSMSSLNGYNRVIPFNSSVLRMTVQVADGEPEIKGYIDNQTDELKSTDGSSGVMSDISGQGASISQNLNFVQQTGQFVTGAFDAVTNADASQGLTFPGLTIMGHEIIPPQEVAFLGYLGADLEQTIKNGVTLVLFLAWLMGLRSIYHKIFLGEQEVEVIEE